MPKKSCKSNNPVIVFGYFLVVVCWVETRLIASVRNSVGILPNRTDVALQRLCNYDEKYDGVRRCSATSVRIRSTNKNKKMQKSEFLRFSGSKKQFFEPKNNQKTTQKPPFFSKNMLILGKFLPLNTENTFFIPVLGLAIA